MIVWLRPAIVRVPYRGTRLTRPLPCETRMMVNPSLTIKDQTVSGNPEPRRYTVHARTVLDAAGQCGAVTNP